MGMLPVFNSAPRLRIGKTITDSSGKQIFSPLAVAIGLDINVSIDITPVYILGDISPSSLEPTMYNVVTGTMQVMRFLSGKKRADLIAQSKTLQSSIYGNKPPATAGQASGAVSPAMTNSYNPAPTVTEEDVEFQIKMYMHLDPRVVMLSETFDIDVQLNVPMTASLTALNVDTKTAIDSTSSGSTILSGFQTPKFNYMPWLSIKNVRLTSANTNISIGQLINEPVSFQGLLATPYNSGSSKAAFALDVGQQQQS